MSKCRTDNIHELRTQSLQSQQAARVGLFQKSLSQLGSRYFCLSSVIAYREFVKMSTSIIGSPVRQLTFALQQQLSTVSTSGVYHIIQVVQRLQLQMKEEQIIARKCSQIARDRKLLGSYFELTSSSLPHKRCFRNLLN